jgi:hypothetical protein
MSPINLPFPDRESLADTISAFGEADCAKLALIFENPAQDDVLLDGLLAYLDRAAGARFLNSLKLEKAGTWFGNHAPARLQIRLMELARSSQHAAYEAFRTGLAASGGLERAYPKA